MKSSYSLKPEQTGQPVSIPFRGDFAHFTLAITVMQLDGTQFLAVQILSILLRVELLFEF